ncbi:MAG: YfbU family protein [Pseudonocardiaceae bacterium]
MATVTLRLDDRTRDQLEEFAQARELTVSDLLRRAIDELLGNGVDAPRADAPRSMSMVQRRTFALLHEILQQLSGDEGDADYHGRRVRALNEGFAIEYHKEFTAVEAELAPAECALVMDLLDMFTVLESAIDKLDSNALAELDRARDLLEFHGFDHNDPRESRLSGFAKYLIDDGRWTSLAHHFDDEHEGGNSHMPMLATYQRMLPAYNAAVSDRKKSSGSRGFAAYHFDVNDLKKVLAATGHLQD